MSSGARAASGASGTMTCGEALIRLLEAYGVDTVFGIPGVHTLDLYRGLAASSIRHVQARNEQGAGFMADGYARASGRPGVCVLITGPGVTNAATPLGQSYADSLPVLMISSANATDSLGKGWGCLHEITDQRAVTAPLTALSAVALAPDDVPELIGQAFSLFASRRPRPVHIAVPIDVLAMPVATPWTTYTVAHRPAPDARSVDAATERLRAARRPVIYAGGGAAEAGPEIVCLAEGLGAPVITSIAGKGIVPENHPLSLGATLQRPVIREYLASADVILAIGTEMSETDSYVKRLEFGGELIRVDIDPAKINDRYPAAVGIVADAAATAAALATALGDTGAAARMPATGRRVAELRATVNAQITPLERRHQRVLSTLREALPDDTIVMGDITQIVYTGSFTWPTDHPRSWHYPAGYCTLGCALPDAIGAKLAFPERAVIAIAGDGGFMFTVQELMVAIELEMPLPILLWNNDGLGQIRDNMAELDIPSIGVSPRNPDFVKTAEAFGCRGVRPPDAESLIRAVRDALHAGGPTLIEVRQDAEWLAADA